MSQTLIERIQDDVKTAMRARDKERLGVLRMVTAAIKQREVDGRTSLDDAGIVAVLDKMIKQRRDARDQFLTGGRQDLVEKEAYEIEIIQAYMPAALSETEVDERIAAAIQESSAQSIKDMGKVMAVLRPEIQGRADMGAVSARVKERLAGTT